MIAACPKCGARYRIEREKLRPEGVRLRCSKCEAVFKVRPPEPAPAPAPAPAEPVAAEAPAAPEPPVRTPEPAAAQVAPSTAASAPASAAPPASAGGTGPGVLVAMPDAELARRTGELLVARGMRVMRVGDGVEAMLEIQRQLPVAVVLSAQLPRMYGFQICEIVKRNESLQHIKVVLAGAIHHKDRYRRPPGELYGADAYIEEPDLPEGLPAVLEGAGVPLGEGAAAAASPVASAPEPVAAAAPEPAPAAAPAAAAPVAPERRGDGLDDERAKAERLARIIVSDIVLYNEDKFAAAIRDGRVAEAMEGDLAEGRGLFRDRIDERVRGEKDFLREELLRVARARGMA